MRRHQRGRLDRLSRRQAHPCCRHQSPLTTNRGARCHPRPQRHIPLATSCPSRAWGGEVHTRGRTIARMGQWQPRLLPQRRHRHRQAWLILHRQLGPIPPTHTEPWGGFAKGRWHPRLLPQRRQRHRRARPVLSCRLGLLPPTLYQQWGGAPPRRQAMLCLAVFSVWHLPCLQTQDLLIKIHG